MPYFDRQVRRNRARRHGHVLPTSGRPSRKRRPSRIRGWVNHELAAAKRRAARADVGLILRRMSAAMGTRP